MIKSKNVKKTFSMKSMPTGIMHKGDRMNENYSQQQTLYHSTLKSSPKEKDRNRWDSHSI